MRGREIVTADTPLHKELKKVMRGLNSATLQEYIINAHIGIGS
jgi:hypothetical protein